MVRSDTKPLILLHGALGSAEQLSPLSSRLGEYVEAHPLDLPGHGDQPLDDRPFTLASFAAHVEQYVQKQGLQQPLVFGHSMGGAVAMMLARQRPGLLGGIVTLGTKLLWTPEIAGREVGLMDPDKIEQKVPAFARTLQQRHRALGWKSLLEHTRRMTLELGERPPLAEEDFRALSLPVFLGVAERDHLVPLDEARHVASVLPQSRVWTIAGAHPLESVDADALVAEILSLTTAIPADS